MAFEPGVGTLDRVSKVESWTLQADIDLYGRNGDIGVIREHRDRVTTDKALSRFFRNAIITIGAIGGIPAILLLLSVLHVIKIP
jgi:hypothetical protein